MDRHAVRAAPAAGIGMLTALSGGGACERHRGGAGWLVLKLAEVRRFLRRPATLGAVLVVMGEPCSGKTTLLAEVDRIALSSGMRTLSAAGRESESHMAFAGLHQLLGPSLLSSATACRAISSRPCTPPSAQTRRGVGRRPGAGARCAGGVGRPGWLMAVARAGRRRPVVGSRVAQCAGLRRAAAAAGIGRTGSGIPQGWVADSCRREVLGNGREPAVEGSGRVLSTNSRIPRVAGRVSRCWTRPGVTRSRSSSCHEHSRPTRRRPVAGSPSRCRRPSG